MVLRKKKSSKEKKKQTINKKNLFLWKHRQIKSIIRKHVNQLTFDEGRKGLKYWKWCLWIKNLSASDSGILRLHKNLTCLQMFDWKSTNLLRECLYNRKKRKWRKKENKKTPHILIPKLPPETNENSHPFNRKLRRL